MIRSLSLILLVVGCQACQSKTFYTLNTRQPIELGRVSDENEGESTYRLDLAGNSRDMTLLIRSERSEERPDTGFQVREVTKRLAQKQDLVPYRGLFVSSVRTEGPAGNAGLLPGDLLISLNGEPLRYRTQMRHLVKTWPGDGEIELTVERGTGDEKKQQQIRIQPVRKTVRLPVAKAIKLAPAKLKGRAYAGIVTGTLPAEWTEKIYGDRRDTVLIGGVYVGSPAYLAGIRSGDRIESVGGEHFASASALEDFVERAGAEGRRVPFVVYRADGGRFEADVQLSDFRGGSDVNVPFLFDYESNTSSTDWDAGPFGLIASYDGDYHRSETRAPNYDRRFSILAGLFRKRWTPRSSRTWVLWFINWRS